MSEPIKDPAHLLLQVAKGDRAAFRALYGATGAKLYGIVFRISKRREVADELMQEVWVRIWEKAADFDPGKASAITWMAAVARNRALDEIRRKGLAISPDADAEVQAIPDEAPLALAQVERAEDGRRLADCLGRLEAGRREIVMLAYLDGWSREELAQRFGAPTATIKTWLHRSLKQLKDCLSV